jgi:hypothetical protein
MLYQSCSDSYALKLHSVLFKLMCALRVGLIYSVSSNKNIFPNLEVFDLICILGTADVCSLVIWVCVFIHAMFC